MLIIIEYLNYTLIMNEPGEIGQLPDIFFQLLQIYPLPCGLVICKSRMHIAFLGLTNDPIIPSIPQNPPGANPKWFFAFG
jgi:hypothetical protein